MKYYNKFLILLLIIISLAFLITNQASADIGFAVKMLNDNSNKSITHLQLSPKATSSIDFQIINYTNSQAKFKTSINTAITNPNLVIDYTGGKSSQIDSSIPTLFENIVKNNNQIINVPAKSKQTVKIPVKMPAKKFDGMLLGGLYVTKKDKKSANQFSFVQPIAITETNQALPRKIKYKNTKLLSKHWTVFLNPTFVNPTSTTIGGVTIKTSIRDKNGKEILKKRQINGRIAPNTIFSTPIKSNKKKFPAGKYQLISTITDEKGTNWNFTDTFKITDQASNKAFEKAQWKKQRNYFIPIILAATFVIIIVFGILKIKGKGKRKNKSSRH